MEFSKQEYWCGLPCPPPGDLPNLGIKLGSPALQADSLPAELPGKPSSLHMDKEIPKSRIAESKSMYMYAVLIDTIKLPSKMNVPSYNSM